MHIRSREANTEPWKWVVLCWLPAWSVPLMPQLQLDLVRRPRGRLFLHGYAIWFIAAPDMLVHIGRGYEGRD
jgi:hypothetical protein